MRCISLFLFLTVLTVSGTTYYVRTDGNNGNDGLTDSAGGAWRNVYYAAATATAGDTVIVKAGTYNEYVTNTVSGSAGSPITFIGERSGANWTTIIDPSVDASTGWYTNSGLGYGIWTNATLGLTVRNMTIGGKLVLPTPDGDISSLVPLFYSTNWTTGIQVMSLPSATVVGGLAESGGPYYLEFWDGIEAMFFSTGTVCGLRLRDGSSPEGLDIQVAANAAGFEVFTPTLPAWRCAEDYIVVSNIFIRNAFAGFMLDGSHHVALSSNRVLNTQIGLYVGNGAYANTISGNKVETDYYGGTPGAWEGGMGADEYNAKSQIYIWTKIVGNTANYYQGLSLYNSPGASNAIVANTLSNGVGQGIVIYGGATPVGWTTIASNSFYNFASIGIYFESHQTNTLIHDNLISDCNANLRAIFGRSEPMRSIYNYRNRLWLPDDVGEHIGLYYASPSALKPTFWVYHNSASGGVKWMQFGSGFYADSGATNVFVVNNISANCNLVACEANFATDATMLGAWDYNLHGPYTFAPDPAWLAIPNSIKATTNQWSNVAGMSFAIPANSQAVGVALDTSTSFTVNGRNSSALPDTAVKVGTDWDMGALEYQPPANRRITTVTLRIDAP